MSAYWPYTWSFIIPNDIVEQKPKAPDQLALPQNYPNPFDAQTVIDYALPEPTSVSLDVYDILGHRVATLVTYFDPTRTGTV